MAFAHLHVHTEYSLLDGSNKIREYVARVKELGMNSAAITDHGVMYGVIDFYRAAREAGIKPILGCEVYVAPDSRFDKELTGGEERYHHLVLLAENNTGYANLMKIVSRGFTEGYYYKPRVDMEVLQEFHEGIIALSACLAGEVPRFILKGMKDEARKAARKYEACFGKGNYFLELQDHALAGIHILSVCIDKFHDSHSHTSFVPSVSLSVLPPGPPNASSWNGLCRSVHIPPQKGGSRLSHNQHKCRSGSLPSMPASPACLRRNGKSG